MYTIQIYGKVNMTNEFKMYKHQKFYSFYESFKKFINLNSKINKQSVKHIYECFYIFSDMYIRMNFHNKTLIKVDNIENNNNSIESNISICNDIHNEILYVQHFNKDNNKSIKIILYLNKQKIQKTYLNCKKKINIMSKDFTISSILSDD